MASGLSAAREEKGVRRNVVETIVGALVLVVAGIFVFYAFARSDRAGTGGYEIIARFGRVDGLKRGADVTLSGVKVGTVSAIDLDRKDYKAVVHMTVTSGVQVPLDTNAKIISESLLGGMVIVLDPGGDPTMVKPGGEVANTQDAISFTELLAKFMFSGTGSK